MDMTTAIYVLRMVVMVCGLGLFAGAVIEQARGHEWQWFAYQSLLAFGIAILVRV